MSIPTNSDARGNLHAATPGVPGNGRFAAKDRTEDNITLGAAPTPVEDRRAARAARRAEREAAFATGVEHVEFYAELFGNASPPLDNRALNDFETGEFVARQRIAYKRDYLTVEDIDRLEVIPGWTWQEPQDQFLYGAGALIQFEQLGGPVDPSIDTVLADGFPLGKWVANIRAEHATGRLATDRAARLEAIPGWSWKRTAAE